MKRLFAGFVALFDLVAGVPLALVTAYGLLMGRGQLLVQFTLAAAAELLSIVAAVAIFSALSTPSPARPRLISWLHALIAGLLLPAAFSDNPAALVLWLPLLAMFVAMGIAAARALEPESA